MTKLNSVVFHTSRLPELRKFYEGILKLPTGTFQRDGKVLPDYSESYVNYHIEGALLCFETDGDRTDIGTIILNVDGFANFRMKLEQDGVQIVGGNDHYFKIKDPEGRSIIFEPK